jgi:hypothetical protein
MTSFEKSAKREFEMLAKSELDVQNIGGALYAFGSELACLRLERVYRNCGDRVRADYSENRNTWFFRLEPATLE